MEKLTLQGQCISPSPSQTVHVNFNQAPVTPSNFCRKISLKGNLIFFITTTREKAETPKTTIYFVAFSQTAYHKKDTKILHSHQQQQKGCTSNLAENSHRSLIFHDAKYTQR